MSFDGGFKKLKECVRVYIKSNRCLEESSQRRYTYTFLTAVTHFTHIYVAVISFDISYIVRE